ncbi:MAG: phosphoribosylformylglycinamidine synthase subunit PurS [Actinomycetota bacterium]|nr:phosphoribosylformylglycinamidine synthase subunit PurS [Actinomycetota bacterium]
MSTANQTASPNNPTWRVEVRVLPKEGVNDPQGDAIKSGLHALGFAETGSVRCGRFLLLEVIASDAAGAEQSARRMCDRLLANPVIEAYEVRVLTQ